MYCIIGTLSLSKIFLLLFAFLLLAAAMLLMRSGRKQTVKDSRYHCTRIKKENKLLFFPHREKARGREFLFLGDLLLVLYKTSRLEAKEAWILLQLKTF